MNRIMVWQSRRYPNWWVMDPAHDPRFDVLPRLAAAIEDASDLAWGSIVYDRANPDPAVPPIFSPLQLAAMFREAAERIEGYTLSDEV